LPGDMLARLKRPRNSPHLLRVARNGDVLEGYVKHVARGQLRVGQERHWLLSEAVEIPEHAQRNEKSGNRPHELISLLLHLPAKQARRLLTMKKNRWWHGNQRRSLSSVECVGEGLEVKGESLIPSRRGLFPTPATLHACRRLCTKARRELADLGRLPELALRNISARFPKVTPEPGDVRVCSNGRQDVGPG
jgi:hypothetical protein